MFVQCFVLLMIIFLELVLLLTESIMCNADMYYVEVDVRQRFMSYELFGMENLYLIYRINLCSTIPAVIASF